MTVGRRTRSGPAGARDELPRPVHAGGQRSVADALVAGAVAALLSGLPSTVHALRTGADPLEASRAAGTLVLGAEARSHRLLAAAALVHVSLSLGWALVLAATLPGRLTTAAGGLAGGVIAALDLGIGGRRFPRIRRLPLLPQVMDHIGYGALVGSVLARRSRRRHGDVVAVRALPAPPAEVFEFLADLHNHWRLDDRFVELSALEGDEDSRAVGGRVRLKGPFGISRDARTRVLSARPPAHDVPGRLAGRADIGTATTGRVSWEIAARDDGGSLVTLTAVAEHAAPFDRVLLVCGRWWLQRTFDHALLSLERILGPEDAGCHLHGAGPAGASRSIR